MNRKKFVVLTLLLVVIFTLTTCLLVACDPNTPDNNNDDPVTATEGLLITNGDFKVVDATVSSYPRKITNWSGAKMYSSGDYRDDVIAGAVNVSDALYAANKTTWGDDDETIKALLTKDGRYGENDAIKNVLMIYMPEESTNSDDQKIHGPTAYGFTSSSFTLSKGSYYKLSVDVLTYKIDGDNENDRGARIYLSSATYADEYGIDTNGEWQTYEFYIETSPSSTTNLSIMLGLGKYSTSFTTGKTTGYAFFDNVVLKKLTDDEVKDDDVANEHADDPAQLYLDKVGVELEQQDRTDLTLHTVTATLKVPNGHFDYGSPTRSSSGAPNLWSQLTGNSGKGDDAAPASLGLNATINGNNMNDEFANYSGTFYYKNTTSSGSVLTYKPAEEELKDRISSIAARGNKLGNSFFMLSQQQMTAQGIKSSRTITIEKNKAYILSVDLYTVGIHGAGVSLILSGSDGEKIEIKGISQNLSSDALIGSWIIDPSENYSTFSSQKAGVSSDGWKTYKFYIKGNPYLDYTYNMEIWLGTGGNSDNTRVTYQRYNSGGSASASTTYTANGTYSNGWVFIDEVNLKERSMASATSYEDGDVVYDSGNSLDIPAIGNNYNAIAVDLANNENLFGEGSNYVLDNSQKKTTGTIADAGHTDEVDVINGTPSDWKSNFYSDKDAKNRPVIKDLVKEGIVDLTSKELFNAPEGLKNAVYPELPYDMPHKNAYAVLLSGDSRYEVETKEIDIPSNSFYRISLWVKTVDVKSTSGMKIYLLDRTPSDETTDEYTETSLVSTAFINTDNYDEYYNDWCEVRFFIRGAEDEDKKVSLKFTFGEGDKFDTDTLTSGAMYLANLNMNEITYSNFSAAGSGSTYQKVYNFATSSTSYSKFTNGLFDNYDMDDENMEQNKPLTEQTTAIAPLNWTVSDNTLGANEAESDLFAGVIALDTEDKDKGDKFVSSTQATTATGLSADVFNAFYNGINAEIGSDDYADGIGGPNFLAIGSKNTDSKFAMGYASSSFSLSANSYYRISVFVKTVGATKASVFLTGEASAKGENIFEVTSEAAGKDWTKYTFYIQVGRTSVSLKLNLWLGNDVKYIADEKDADYEQKKEQCKSSGAVFFDSVRNDTIDEEEFNKHSDSDTEKVISFMTDSFDALSDDVSSRKSLSSPNGWSGSVDNSSLSSSNSRMGVIYTDSNYFDTEHVDGVDYVKIVGKDYKIEDIEYTADELNDAIAAADRNSDEYRDMTDDQFKAAIETKLKDDKLMELKKQNWLPVEQLYTNDPDRAAGQVLIINNTVKSAYTYKSNSNTLKESKYYRVSVWVRTYGLSDGEKEGAYIELYLGSANNSSNPFKFEAIRADEWTEYCFYVKTADDDVTSVTINLSLGTYISEEDEDGNQVISGTTSGFAMFDDVSVTEITDEEFDAKKAEDDENALILTRELTNDNEGDVNGGEEPGGTEKPSFNLDYLWWMIPTLVLGLVIIVVLVVFIIRKVRKPGKRVEKIQQSTPDAAQTLNEKRERYDDDKE